MPHVHTQSIAISNSTMAAALNRSNLVLHSRLRNLFAFRKTFSCSIFSSAIPNSKATKFSASRSRNLFSRISPLRQDYDVVRALDQWVAEGQKLHSLELQRIIRDLRSRRRFSHALQISEWISHNHVYKLSPADFAVHLDLIGAVRGCEAADIYFSSLSEQDKNEKTYGTLLNCYAREGLLTKVLLLMQRMKDMGYVSSSLSYNNLIALYKKLGQLEKIPQILSEMKNNGVSPNNFTYRICINAYGERSDLVAMEKLLEEIELKSNISLDWATYSVVAYHYIKGNEKGKAVIYMKRMEEKLNGNGVGYNHLISLYAHLGDKNEMMRLWALQKFVCKKQINRDYITILGSLVKIGDLETAEEVLKEWDRSCHVYNFRVPNILLIGYCQKGLIEKSEKMLRDIVKSGKEPTPNSWGIIAGGYLGNDNFEKAYECMKEALAVKENNTKWVPKPGLVSRLLEWIGDNGEINEVEAFVWSLRTVVLVNGQMYEALIKASVRVGRDVDWILDCMKADKIDVDDEIEKIISLRRRDENILVS